MMVLSLPPRQSAEPRVRQLEAVRQVVPGPMSLSEAGSQTQRGAGVAAENHVMVFLVRELGGHVGL